VLGPSSLSSLVPGNGPGICSGVREVRGDLCRAGCCREGRSTLSKTREKQGKGRMRYVSRRSIMKRSGVGWCGPFFEHRQDVRQASRRRQALSPSRDAGGVCTWQRLSLAPPKLGMDVQCPERYHALEVGDVSKRANDAPYLTSNVSGHVRPRLHPASICHPRLPRACGLASSAKSVIKKANSPPKCRLVAAARRMLKYNTPAGRHARTSCTSSTHTYNPPAPFKS
jgi:hypothetical protein